MNIFQFEDYRDYLSVMFQERRDKNGSYSLRAFAKSLGISASMANRLLRRTASTQARIIARISERLRHSPAEAEYFMELYKFHESGDISSVRKIQEVNRYQTSFRDLADHLKLSPDDLIIFLKISLLIRIPANEEGARLVGRASNALWPACERLKIANFIDGDMERGWSTQITHVLTNEMEKSARREHHRLMLMNIVEALNFMPVEDRFFYASYQTLSKKDYTELCEKIHSFLTDKRLANTLEADHDMVYLFAAQLIPFEGIEQRGHRPCD